MLWNKNNDGMALEAKATQEVAGPLGVTLQDRGVKDPNELEVVFAVMTKDRPDAFLALMDPVLISYQKRILDFLAKNRVAGDIPKQRLGRSWRSHILRAELSRYVPARRRPNGQD